MSKEVKEEKQKSDWGLFSGLGLGVLIIWGASWYLTDDLTNRGTFGDMFGAVNALFSGLAFAGVIAAIYLQKQELGLQRQELEETRNEMKLQSAEFKEQNTTLKLQRFETTFFNLLNMHSDVVNSFSYDRYNGSSALDQNIRLLLYEFKARDEKGRLNSELDIINLCKEFFDGSFRLRQYCNSVKAVFELIDNYNIDDPSIYINILDSLITDSEKVIIYYFSQTQDNGETLKDLLTKYAFFKSLPQSKLWTGGKAHITPISLMPQQAFGNRHFAN